MIIYKKNNETSFTIKLYLIFFFSKQKPNNISFEIRSVNKSGMRYSFNIMISE